MEKYKAEKPLPSETSTDRKIGASTITAINRDTEKDVFLENIKFPTEEARDVQLDFGKRVDTLGEGGETISQEEFEKWEEDYALYYNMALGEIRKEGLHLTIISDLNKAATGLVRAFPYWIRSDDKKAEFEKQLSTTVEAQAGHFFTERNKMLRHAVMEADVSDEERASDLEIIKQFYPAVQNHLYYKYMDRETIRNWPSGERGYEKQRTEAHNQAMKSLNNLNDLARKYGTKPFTARNFWPSDMCPDLKSQEAPLSRIFRCDRDIVEEYYTIVFNSDVRKYQYEMERNMKYGTM